MTEGKILTKHPSGKTGRNIDRQKYEPVKRAIQDRKSTRLNSSHSQISYAVFCLKKKKQNKCRRSAGNRGSRSRSLPSFRALTIPYGVPASNRSKYRRPRGATDNGASSLLLRGSV